jgi:septum formation inhibitor MinC
MECAPSDEVIEVLRNEVLQGYDLLVKDSKLFEKRKSLRESDDVINQEEIGLNFRSEVFKLSNLRQDKLHEENLLEENGLENQVVGSSVVSKESNSRNKRVTTQIPDSKYLDSKKGPPEVLGVDLFKGVKGLSVSIATSNEHNSDDVMDLLSGDVPNSRLVTQTLRSGQKIESPNTVIIIGDVNSGAEVRSAGHVIVLGTLRGIAHAGSDDDDTSNKKILALNLRPTQLRIGTVISRGGDSSAVKLSSTSKTGNEKFNMEPVTPEVAYVENGNIIVDNYNNRVFQNIK